MTTLNEYLQDLVDQEALIKVSETSFIPNNDKCLYEWYAPDRQTNAHVETIDIINGEIKMGGHFVDKEWDITGRHQFHRSYRGSLSYKVDKFPYDQFKVLPNKL